MEGVIRGRAVELNLSFQVQGSMLILITFSPFPDRSHYVIGVKRPVISFFEHRPPGPPLSYRHNAVSRFLCPGISTVYLASNIDHPPSPKAMHNQIPPTLCPNLTIWQDRLPCPQTPLPSKSSTPQPTTPASSSRPHGSPPSASSPS